MPTAGPWADRIGDRLDHPERVPPEFQHLIADDQQRVARILSIPVAGHVLDVGCSDRSITKRIAQRWLGATVVGVDKDEWDIRQPPPRAEPFDAIFCCEVLEHLTDREAHLARTHLLARLKPEGTLVITVPNIRCALHYTVGCRDRWRWPDHRSAWRYEKLHKFLVGAGLTVTFHRIYPADTVKTGIWLFCEATR